LDFGKQRMKWRSHYCQWRSQEFTAGYSIYKKFSKQMCNSNKQSKLWA
jgi:hypothetical protein